MLHEYETSWPLDGSGGHQGCPSDSHGEEHLPCEDHSSADMIATTLTLQLSHLGRHLLHCQRDHRWYQEMHFGSAM